MDLAKNSVLKLLRNKGIAASIGLIMTPLIVYMLKKVLRLTNITINVEITFY